MHYVLVAHMYKHIGALHVSGVEFYSIRNFAQARCRHDKLNVSSGYFNIFSPYYHL
jgi:hypothetical protein